RMGARTGAARNASCRMQLLSVILSLYPGGAEQEGGQVAGTVCVALASALAARPVRTRLIDPGNLRGVGRAGAFGAPRRGCRAWARLAFGALGPGRSLGPFDGTTDQLLDRVDRLAVRG